jgi:hypothetical protein
MSERSERANSLILAAVLLASSSCLRAISHEAERSTPRVTLRGIPSAFIEATADPVFTFDSNQSGRFECRLDSASFSPCRSPHAYAGLAKGVHAFEVRLAMPDGQITGAALHRWTIQSGRSDRWIAPMPFIAGHMVRPDFPTLYTKPESWAHVRMLADVFKFYLRMLPPDSGVDLDALVRTVNDAGLKTAFEVGGLRLYDPTACAPNVLGDTTADVELALLRRWAQANGGTGRIDYLTTDHAIATTIEAAINGTCHLSYVQAARELAVYFKRAKDAFPSVKLGMIEALGYWNVRGPDGVTVYHRTRRDLPVIQFSEMLDAAIEEAAKLGVRLDHFDIDYGAEGAEIDATPTFVRQGPGLVVNHHDYGRFKAVQDHVRARGLNAGLIYNAFHKDGNGQPYPTTVSYPTEAERVRASRRVRARTLTVFDEYRAIAGDPNRFVFQFWQPFPHLTGPETVDYTSLGIMRDLLARVR